MPPLTPEKRFGYLRIAAMVGVGLVGVLIGYAAASIDALSVEPLR